MIGNFATRQNYLIVTDILEANWQDVYNSLLLALIFIYYQELRQRL